VHGYLHIRSDNGDEIVERNTIATFMDEVQITEGEQHKGGRANPMDAQTSDSYALVESPWTRRPASKVL
jgi:hypothetical protein